MRTSDPTAAIEMLLRALYEGTASDLPWVAHNGVAWTKEELACQPWPEPAFPYQDALTRCADAQIYTLTRETTRVVRDAADQLLILLDRYDSIQSKEKTDDPGQR